MSLLDGNSRKYRYRTASINLYTNAVDSVQHPIPMLLKTILRNHIHCFPDPDAGFLVISDLDPNPDGH